MNSVFALCISILIGVGGQLCFKAGAVSGLKGLQLFFQPFIIIAFIGYGVSALLYIYALREIPVGIAYPSIAVSYFAVAWMAHLIWNEPFGVSHLLGLALIGAGIFLIARPLSI